MLAKKFAIGFGVAVLLPMVIHYGVSTFSKEPRWQDYHKNRSYYSMENKSVEEKERIEKEDQKMQDRYDSDSKRFARHLFFVAALLGIVAIILGAFISFQAIGAGLIFGGIFTLTDGYCRYWDQLQDWMRFLSLLVAFIVIVYFGYVKIADKTKKI